MSFAQLDSFEREKYIRALKLVECPINFIERLPKRVFLDRIGYYPIFEHLNKTAKYDAQRFDSRKKHLIIVSKKQMSSELVGGYSFIEEVLKELYSGYENCFKTILDAENSVIGAIEMKETNHKEYEFSVQAIFEIQGNLKEKHKTIESSFEEFRKDPTLFLNDELIEKIIDDIILFSQNNETLNDHQNLIKRFPLKIPVSQDFFSLKLAKETIFFYKTRKNTYSAKFGQKTTDLRNFISLENEKWSRHLDYSYEIILSKLFEEKIIQLETSPINLKLRKIECEALKKADYIPEKLSEIEYLARLSDQKVSQNLSNEWFETIKWLNNPQNILEKLEYIKKTSNKTINEFLDLVKLEVERTRIEEEQRKKEVKELVVKMKEANKE